MLRVDFEPEFKVCVCEREKVCVCVCWGLDA